MGAIVQISKQERKKLIKAISKASGVAQYALDKKMSDEQIVKAAQNLETLEYVKSANQYNRHCQKLKTQEANQKLKKFLDVQNSELLSAGKWLFNALSNTGQDRKQTLLEKNLVHKEDYNETVSGMHDSIITISSASEQSIAEAKSKIIDLEQRIDTLKGQLIKIQDYISFNYGADKWKAIKDTFNIN